MTALLTFLRDMLAVAVTVALWMAVIYGAGALVGG